MHSNIIQQQEKVKASSGSDRRIRRVWGKEIRKETIEILCSTSELINRERKTHKSTVKKAIQ